MTGINVAPTVLYQVQAINQPKGPNMTNVFLERGATLVFDTTDDNPVVAFSTTGRELGEVSGFAILSGIGALVAIPDGVDFLVEEAS